MVHIKHLTHKLTPGLLGVTFSIAAGSQVLNFALPLWVIIIVLGIFYIIGFWLARFLLYKQLQPFFVNRPRRTWIISGLVSLITGLYLVYYIPLTIYPKLNSFTVVATGEKNPLSMGSEVWVTRIVFGKKATSVKPADICQGDNWEIRDGNLVSYQKQPGDLICTVKTDTSFMVMMVKHAWSGKVQIVFDNQIIEEDLFYAEGNNTAAIQYDVKLGPGRSIIRYIIWFCLGIWIGLLILTFLVWFICRPVSLPLQFLVSPIPWYYYAAPMLFVWGLYLLSFWPGLVPPDVLIQWEQITSGQFFDWHPAFHTWTMWLITRVWLYPAAVAIAQIVIFSIVLGWGLSLLQRWGMSTWMTIILEIFLLSSPAFGLLAINLWKDTFYSISLVVFTLLILHVVNTNASWIDKPFNMLLLVFIAALVALYRHNGYPVAFGTLGVLVLFYPQKLKRIIPFAIVAIGIYGLIRGPVYEFVGVNTGKADMGRNLGVEGAFFTLMRYHKSAGTTFTETELELYNRVIEGNVRQESEGALAGNRRGAWAGFIATDSNRIIWADIQLTLRDPVVTLRYLDYKSSYIFQIFRPPTGRIGYVALENPSELFGFTVNSRLPGLRSLITSFTTMTERAELDWFFWRNAFWMYLLGISVLVACLRTKSIKYLLVLCPILFNAIPLTFLSAGHLARYIYPTLILGPMLSGYLFTIARPRSITSDKEQIMNKLKKIVMGSLQISRKLLRIANPGSILRTFFQQRFLIIQMVQRDIGQRYRGTYLGILWSVITPLLLLLIYTFVFSVIFKARWNVADENSSMGEFAIILFAGLTPYYLFTDVVTRSTTIVLTYPNFVKKVVFPLEILVIMVSGTAVFTSLINLGIIILAMGVFMQSFHLTTLLLPLIYLPLIFISLGVGWFLAALGVYIRDISQFIGLIMQVLLFLSPIFYPISAVPENFRFLLSLNPLMFFITEFRNLLIWGEMLSWQNWGIWMVISCVIALLGYSWFIWIKKGFADVL